MYSEAMRMAIGFKLLALDGDDPQPVLDLPPQVGAHLPLDTTKKKRRRKNHENKGD